MKLKIRAYHIGKRFESMKKIELVQFSAVKSDSTFRLYQLDADSFVYFKNFGAIVFINCDEKLIAQTLQSYSSEKITLQDKYELVVEQETDLKSEFETFYISEMNVDMIHIICLNIAQSLALDQYQSEVDLLLEKSRKITKKLEATGRISFSQRRLAMFTGEIMNLRTRIADNLYIFEAPPLAWKDPKLAEMDELMNIEFDFRNRHQAIQHSLAVVRDNHDFFNNLLQHKHSSMLEWIIIILILFEVVHILI